MVNKLSDLTEFLHNDSLPGWLKSEIEERQGEILVALEHGVAFTLSGPNGEQVKISPELVAA